MDYNINIANALQNSELIYEEEADLLYPDLETAILNEQKICLSFVDVSHTSTLFMNALIGRLYQQFGLKVDGLLSTVVNDNEIIANMISRVRNRALKTLEYSPIFTEALNN